ncbi:hypothetical protein [Paucihalobacter sp.]|uniref:hypothetical protein n=1 Tax=Paucihalobacter sp. TaxID=2850405 RepID=UPI002FE1DCAC
MTFLKIFQYAYLVVAVLFLYEAFKAWNTEGKIDYMSLFFFALALFLFFFRRKFRKRFEDRGKQ